MIEVTMSGLIRSMTRPLIMAASEQAVQATATTLRVPSACRISRVASVHGRHSGASGTGSPRPGGAALSAAASAAAAAPSRTVAAWSRSPARRAAHGHGGGRAARPRSWPGLLVHRVDHRAQPLLERHRNSTGYEADQTADLPHLL